MPIAGCLAASSLDEFRAWSVQHVLVYCALVLVTTGMICIRRRAGDADSAARIDRWFAVGLFTVFCVIDGHSLLPGHLRWDKSLPLHVCDVTLACAATAMWTNRRFARTVLYFWGIGLSSQAFFTPMLAAGPAHLEFWYYWVFHIAIVSAAFYDLIARVYRPTWRDWEIAAVASTAYILMVLAIDVRLGVNYGYLGNTEFAQRTIMRALGRWPGRVVKMQLLVWAVTALMMLPFTRRKTASQALQTTRRNPSFNPWTHASQPLARAA